MTNPGRLEVSGRFGVASATHWLASQTAMGVLERGGNAFDATVAGAFVLQVAQPHLNGPLGDVVALVMNGATGTVETLCGQGPTPVALDQRAFAALGLDLVPGTGLVPAVVPGAFDAYMLLLQTRGTASLREVLEPAIAYGREGVPVGLRLERTLAAAVPIFQRFWPTSAAHYGNQPLQTGDIQRNTVLADWLERLVDEAEASAGRAADREGVIERARHVWAEGFVAGAIDDFCRSTRVMDVSGEVHGAFLTGEDLAKFHATLEAPVSARYGGHVVYKPQAWSQGPALLEALGLCAPDVMAQCEATGAPFVHRMTEAFKLALANRDTHFGDPDVSDEAGRTAPDVDALLMPDHLVARSALIGESASAAFRPSDTPHAAWRPDMAAAASRTRAAGVLAAYGGGEPTVQHIPETGTGTAFVGDTAYIAVADRSGNVVSATPSGGWLQSSPVIPALGVPLGTRAQMCWPDEASPMALRPGKRPRTTLSPTIAVGPQRTVAVGSPGGDQQEQWQATFLVRNIVHEMGLQAAMDAPSFHTNHHVSSFYPRHAVVKHLAVEGRFPAETVHALRERGHAVDVVGDWVEGRLCAVAVSRDGTLRAAATPRGGEGHAVGR